MIIRRGSMDDDAIDADFPLTPISPITSFASPLRSSTRKVGFTETAKKTIYRYISPRDADEQWENDSDEDQYREDCASSEDGDAQWWWDGWEESHDDDDDVSTDDERAEDDRVNDQGSDRPRIRRQHAFSLAL